MAQAKGLLDLPRELYLLVCANLTTTSLTNLAVVSRDHYLAVQAPLFSRIVLTSYGALIKLEGPLTRVPVVSRISPKQRLNWHKLSDAELRERDIRHLDLTLDNSKDRWRITGIILSRSIEAISHRCPKVKIDLTLLRLSQKLVNELRSSDFSKVVSLTLFLGSPSDETSDTLRPPGNLDYSHSSEATVGSDVWPFIFSGFTFPSLTKVYINNLVDRAANLPSCMENGLQLAQRSQPRRMPDDNEQALRSADTSLIELCRLEEIKLEYNTLLDATALKTLIGSGAMSHRLTKLEIVNCPSLQPIKDLEVLAMLLHKGLKLLQFLKLHLSWHSDGYDGYEVAYSSQIKEKSKLHLCNVVRQLGSKIKGLDLAIPFACNQMFFPHKKRFEDSSISEPLPHPRSVIPGWPASTFPQRVMDAGYRYRRVIFNGFCIEPHDWREMTASINEQGDMISWEVLYDGVIGEDWESKAVWSLSGCAPIEFSVMDTMEAPFH